jgi:hypothetical protein
MKAKKKTASKTVFVVDTSAPTLRNNVLYVRVTDANKKFVEAEAERTGLGSSLYMDRLISSVREATAKK